MHESASFNTESAGFGAAGYNCTNCHGWHGTSGTGGINRGRLLLDYMDVNQFSATNAYDRKGSCSTSPGGAGMGSSCH